MTMELVAKTAKISTPSDQFFWGGSFAENGFFVLLEVKGNELSLAAKRGQEVLELILTKFTNFKERNLRTVTQLLEEVKENKEIITIIIGLLGEDNLYLGSMGLGVVLMKRGEKIGQILSASEKLQGKVAAGDTLLFCSQTFSQSLTSERKYQILDIKDPEEMTEAIAPILLEQTREKGKAILAVSIDNSQREKLSLNLIGNFREKSMQKITPFLQKVKNIVIRKKPTFEDTQETKSKKTLLTISVVLVTLLTLSIFFNLSHSKTTSKHQKLDQVLDLVSHQYEEAINLIDLNPTRARELLSSSKLSLAPLIAEFPKNSDEYKKVNEWLNKVSSQEVTAYKIYKLTAVPLFFDITLIKQGGEGEKIAAYRETKTILDKKNKVVYILITDTKQASIIAGSETVKEAQTITIHGDNVYIHNNDGIVSINIADKTTKVVIKNDEKWGEIVSVAAFGGNLYLLDRKNHTIWKYILTDFGFSPRQKYLNPDVRVNFAEAQKMMVDGSVWVLSLGSDVSKFTRGLGEPFVFKGLGDTISDIKDIFTSDVEKNLYILDKTSQRILIFDKDGNYQSQYQWEELKNASGLVVSEEEKKIFVLVGSKIYAIEIK